MRIAAAQRDACRCASPVHETSVLAFDQPSHSGVWGERMSSREADSHEVSYGAKPAVDHAALQTWLSQWHGSEVVNLEPLPGGFWSSAWAYEDRGESLVVRLGQSGDGYAIDARAYEMAGSALPVPEVLATGEALGLRFAISRRHEGAILETHDAADAERITARLVELLAALRGVRTDAAQPANWCEQGAAPLDWRGWLRRSLVDRLDSHTAGWRERLATRPDVERVFDASLERIDALLPRCPERRDLVHGDLLHQNVLVSEDLSSVTAVFSWKCSALGDFLYDLAWCTHWAPWFTCIDAEGLYERVLGDAALDGAALEDAALRHECYELQIAASHVGWFLWNDDEENLGRLVEQLEGLLALGGPRFS